MTEICQLRMNLKLHCGKNCALAFTSLHEETFPLPHLCAPGTSHVNACKISCVSYAMCGAAVSCCRFTLHDRLFVCAAEVTLGRSPPIS